LFLHNSIYYYKSKRMTYNLSLSKSNLIIRKWEQ